MNILISSGAGLLGLHLYHRLLKDGHKVFCINNFIVGSVTNIK